MADDVLQNTVTVVVKNISYIFAIPSFADEIRLGLVERDIRRSLQLEMATDGAGMPLGEPTGDGGTEFLVRVAAQFQLLLRKCSSAWPYTAGESGPTVDFRAWPLDKTGEAMQVGVQFDNELRRFRSGGAPDGDAPGTEVVAGQPDTKGVAVRSGPPQS